MVKIYQLTFCIALLIFLQSCYVKQRSNMSFLDRSVVGKEAEVVAVKVPMFLVKPFIAKELKKEDDEMIRLAMKKIKSVKLTALSNAKDNTEIRTRFKDFLRAEQMEEYASVISDGDRVSINRQMKKDKVKKLKLGVSSEDWDYVFIEVNGKFTMDEITHAISSYENN